jgi:hypothetical protein
VLAKLPVEEPFELKKKGKREEKKTNEKKEKYSCFTLVYVAWCTTEEKKKTMQDKKQRHQLKETSIAQRSPPLARNRNTTC